VSHQTDSKPFDDDESMMLEFNPKQVLKHELVRDSGE
jgi:hypothetical protein